ncbi:SDR family oxidoreductase [uncultured Hymenobacter sp.]|uniref:SDR family oxidoreductase n=1 Tax=uncultured Hymenobacter sp. TaxID=170016 RepID=UPI0035CB9890
MNRLQHKVAVITGGNSGIGFATAQEFIAQGAQVVITGRNAQAVQEAVAQLGSQAVGVISDAARMADVRQLATQVQAHHARIDVLFVNAGISYAAPIAEVDEAHFDSQFDINLKGAYFTIQQLLPLLNDNASIILNSSATVHKAFPGISVYVATKAAITSLARTLSLELLDRKIRVNAISPGPIATPINHKMFDKLGMSAEASAQAAEGYAQLVPIKRVGAPQEIASIATFLASDESSFILGEEIIAGGGIGTL